MQWIQWKNVSTRLKVTVIICSVSGFYMWCELTASLRCSACRHWFQIVIAELSSVELILGFSIEDAHLAWTAAIQHAHGIHHIEYYPQLLAPLDSERLLDQLPTSHRGSRSDALPECSPLTHRGGNHDVCDVEPVATVAMIHSNDSSDNKITVAHFDLMALCFQRSQAAIGFHRFSNDCCSQFLGRVFPCPHLTKYHSNLLSSCIWARMKIDGLRHLHKFGKQTQI